MLENTGQSIPQAPVKQPQNSPTETSSSPSLMLWSTIIIVVAVALLGTGYFLFYNKNGKKASKPITTNASVTNTPIPAITPITNKNADQALSNQSAWVQDAINQASADINTMSKIDASQDSSTSL